MANDGTIIEKKRGVWEIQISLGKDSLTGKYKRITRTVHGTKADAKKKRDQIKHELESGLKAESANMTFDEWCTEWLSIRRSKGDVSKSVLSQYETRLKFMSSILGNIRLNKIDARTVENLLIAVKEKRIKQGFTCSDSTIRHYYVLLKQCLKTACDYDLIVKNPCDRVSPPKKNKVNRKSLSIEEANRLLTKINESEHAYISELLRKENDQSDRNNTFDRSYLLGLRNVSLILLVRLGLASGCRQGELLALTWSNVDFEHSRINIVQAMDNFDQLKDPKSAAGVRSIFIDLDTMQHLRVWKSLQGDLLETIGMEVNGNTPVFCTAKGDFILKASFRHWWNTWRSEAGFPELKFHELRHTQASQLLANGMDVKSVQSRMGHSSASLTLDCYAHAMESNDAKAALLIGNLFSQSDKQQPELIESVS